MEDGCKVTPFIQWAWLIGWQLSDLIEDSTNLTRLWFVFLDVNRGRKGLSYRLECNTGLYQLSAFVADNNIILALLPFAHILWCHKCTRLM